MIDLAEAFIVAGVGIVAGVVNTLVGGGTYLALPILSFMGLSAPEANATNRFAVAFQSLAGIGGLRRGRADQLRRALPYALIAALGAGPGAWLAAELPADRFRAVMGYLLLASLVLLFVRPKPTEEATAPPSRLGGYVVCFAIGAYVGFLGAGVGVLILIYLPRVLRISLSEAIVHKILIVLFTSVLASVVFFVAGGLINAAFAVPLVIGNMIGGYWGGRLASKGSERVLRIIVAVLGALMALALVLGF